MIRAITALGRVSLSALIKIETGRIESQHAMPKNTYNMFPPFIFVCNPLLKTLSAVCEGAWAANMLLEFINYTYLFILDAFKPLYNLLLFVWNSMFCAMDDGYDPQLLNKYNRVYIHVLHCICC